MHHRFKICATVLASAVLFGACSNSNEVDPPPPGGGGGGGGGGLNAITLTGVVAKGTLRNAVVRAHAIAANGSVDTAGVLAEALSDDTGHYTLNFNASPGVPYVIRVSARPAGQTPATSQLDEISGATAVPDNFAMRALFVPASGTTSTSASVTPFSELAVAAAEKGSGGVNAANATQARVNVTALMGFDPTTVTPTTIAGAAGGTTQQLALATMLTAVSKLANDSALGCAQATLAERTGCVVSALGSSSTLASTNPGTVAGVNVAAALVTATQAVVAANNVPPTAVAVIVENLQGPGTPPPPGIPTDTQSGIAAARTMFTTLRSDWQALFSGGAEGAAAREADKFVTAMNDVQSPADLLVKDTGALLTGIDLYRDYKAGRTTVPNRGRGEAAEFVDGGDVNAAGFGRSATGCTLYVDTGNTIRATTPAEANSIGCTALYYMTRQSISGGYQVTYWRHGFTVVPPAAPTGAAYSYTTRARRSVDQCTPTCVRTVNDALQANFYAGTIEIAADNDGHVTSFTMQGELPGAFRSGSSTLVNERHEWTVGGTRSPAAVGAGNDSTLTATIASYAAGSTTPIGTLKLTDGKLAEVLVSRTANGAIVRRGHPGAVADAGGEVATGDLPLEWHTPGATFKGRLLAADTVWDASGTRHAPTRVVLSGQFINIDGSGTATEFLAGSATATLTGYGAFDTTLPTNASNRVEIGFQFSGSITAPGRPQLVLTLATTTRTDQEELSSLTAQYRSMVNGMAVQTINIAADNPAIGPGTLSFSEASSNVSLHYTQDAPTAKIRRGTESNGTELGTLTLSTLMVSFVDGFTMSLGGGL